MKNKIMDLLNKNLTTKQTLSIVAFAGIFIMFSAFTSFNFASARNNNIASVSNSISQAKESSFSSADTTGCTTGKARAIEQYGITWTFDKCYTYGTYVNGDYWVQGPVIIKSISPQTTNSGEWVSNGSMINPNVGTSHGFTNVGNYNRTDPDTGAEGYYKSSLNVGKNLPLNISANNSLVSSITNNSNWNNPIEMFAVLTIVQNAPSSGSFRPSPLGNGSKASVWNESQIDYTKLSSEYDKNLLSEPNINSYASDFNKPWIEWDPNWTNRLSHPPYIAPTGYGQWMAQRTADAGLMLNMNYSNAEKRDLLIGMIQIGIDNFGFLQNGGAWYADGGHNVGRLSPIMVAATVLNDNNLKSVIKGSGMKFQEFQNTFFVTQEDVNRRTERNYSGVNGAISIPYSSSDIGLAEWGVRHKNHPIDDNKWLAAPYRSINGSTFVGTTLLAKILGLESFIDHPALFEYTSRYYGLENSGSCLESLGQDESGECVLYNGIPSFHKQFYNLYNGITPPVDPNALTSPTITTPTANKVFPSGTQSVTITWTGSASNYLLRYETNGSNEVQINSHSGNSYTMNNLSDGKTYRFWMHAGDLNNYSDAVEVTFTIDTNGSDDPNNPFTDYSFGYIFQGGVHQSYFGNTWTGGKNKGHIDRLFYNFKNDGYGGLPLGSCLERSEFITDPIQRAICAAGENMDLLWATNSMSDPAKNLLIKNVTLQNAFRTKNAVGGTSINGTPNDVTDSYDLPHTDTFQSYMGSIAGYDDYPQWLVMQDTIIKNSDGATMMMGDMQWKGVVFQNLDSYCEPAFSIDAQTRVNNDFTNFIGSTGYRYAHPCGNQVAASIWKAAPVWLINVNSGLPSISVSNPHAYASEVGPVIIIGKNQNVVSGIWDSANARWNGETTHPNVKYYSYIEDALADGQIRPPYIELSCSGWRNPPAGCETQKGYLGDEPPLPPVSNTYTLTTNTDGDGTGTIEGNTSPYTSGTVVTLTAKPTDGSTFSGWDGCSIENGTTCILTVSSNTTVTATFTNNVDPEPTVQSSLRVSANKHFLETLTGTPFFYLSDTNWALQRRPRSDISTLITDRKNKGFSVIKMAATGENDCYNWIDRIDYFGNRPFLNGNVTQFNSAWWNNLESIVDEIGQKGMYVELTIGGPARKEWDPEWAKSNQAAYEYGRQVGERFKDKDNVIFNIGQDQHPDLAQWGCGLQQGGIGITGYRAIAEGVADGVNDSTDGYNQRADYSTTLMTFHPGGSNPYTSSSRWFQGDAWLDANGTEIYDNRGVIYEIINGDYNLSPAKPSLFIEGSYEESASRRDYPNSGRMVPHFIRNEAWHTYFAGGAGYTYGNSENWSQYTGQTNINYLNSEGAQHMKIVKDFMTAREWWKFVPDQGMIASGVNSGNTRVVGVKSTDGDEAYVYFPTRSTATIKMDRITTKSNVEVKWFDPRNGNTVNVGTYSNTSTQTVTPPSGYEDAVLMILESGTVIPTTFTLTTNTTGTGSGTISGNTSPYNSGTVVTLTATPASDSTFTGWTGCTGVFENVCTVTMDGNKTVSAVFTKIEIPPSLTITAPTANQVFSSDTTSVTVSWTGNASNYLIRALDLTDSKLNNKAYNTYLVSDTHKTNSVSMNVIKGHSYMFWVHGGTLSNYSEAAEVIFSVSNSVTPTTYTLTATTNGDGSGAITGNTTTYIAGDLAILTATPASDSTFTGWTGCTGVFENVCTVTMNSNTTVTATFTKVIVVKPKYTLTANISGTGSGTISGNLTPYEEGDLAILTATPSYGSNFIKWTGCSGAFNNICTVNMTSNKTVTATFDSYDYTDPTAPVITVLDVGQTYVQLSWTESEDDTGVIAYDLFQDGEYRGTETDVDDRMEFFWSLSPETTYELGVKAMDGFGNMSEMATVEVTTLGYVKNYTLTTSASNGTITKSPNQATYTSGTSVTLTATPASGYQFSSWSGCSSSTNTCTVTMDGNKTVSAVFTKIEIPPSLTITAPTANQVFSSDTTSVTVSWTGNASNYLIRAKDLTDSRLNRERYKTYIVSDTYKTNSVAIPVQKGHSYEFWVHSGTLKDYSEAVRVNFSVSDITIPGPTEAPIIVSPTTNQVFSNTTTSVDISWLGSASNYLIRALDLTDSKLNNKAYNTYLVSDTHKTNSVSMNVIKGHSYRFWIHSGTLSSYSPATEVMFSVNN